MCPHYCHCLESSKRKDGSFFKMPNQGWWFLDKILTRNMICLDFVTVSDVDVSSANAGKCSTELGEIFWPGRPVSRLHLLPGGQWYNFPAKSGKNNGVTLNQNALGALTQASCMTWVKWLACAFSLDPDSLSYLLGYQSRSPGNFTAIQYIFK